MQRARPVQFPKNKCRHYDTRSDVDQTRMLTPGAARGHCQGGSKYLESCEARHLLYLTCRLSRKASCSSLSACQSPVLMPARRAASLPSRAVICSQSVPGVLPLLACSSVAAVSSPVNRKSVHWLSTPRECEVLVPQYYSRDRDE